MKNTNSKEFKQAMRAYLIECMRCSETEKLSESDLIAHCKQRWLKEVYRGGNAQESVRDWLQGLAIDIEYTYCDIIKVAEKLHGCKIEDEEMIQKIIYNWFNLCSFHLLRMFNFED